MLLMIGLSAGGGVEGDQAFHGALDDGADTAAECFGGFRQYVPVIIGYRADEVDGHLAVTIIVGDVTFEEGFERVEHQLLDGGIIDVLTQKRCD